MAPEVQLEVTSTLTPAIAADTETSSSADHVETSTATPGDAGSGSGSGGGDALPPPPLKASAGTEAAACCPAAELDDLMLLGILRCMPDMDLVALRLVSRRLRCLADLVLEESFRRRWGVADVAAPPPAAPAFAAVRAASWVLAHRLEGRDSLAALAVRYGTDPTQLKRLNNLLSEHALAARTHLYVPLADPASAATGKRCAFLHDEHSRRRLVAILRDGDEPPGGGSGGGGGDGRQRSRDFVVAKLAAVLQRALRIDQPTAAYYVQAAGCDVREAIAKFEEDRRWERLMLARGSRLQRP